MIKYGERSKGLQEIQAVIDQGPFQENWQSLTNFRMPEWFEDAKFGIFIHWGVFSVPAFGSEWYSRNMYVQGSLEYEHHIKTYGAQKEFGYKDFIPMFRAENFHAEEWAQLIWESGARYVMPVAEHHDGFLMYPSELSHFNALEMGPKRDVLGEIKQAVEKKGIFFAASSHRAEHWWFMGPGKSFDSDMKEPLVCGDFYWPSVEQQPDFQDLYAKPYPTGEYCEDWLLRTCELVDKYRPAVLYFDWWIQHEVWKPYLKKFAAFYYNRGVEWGFPTAICYKYDAMPMGSGIVDVERGKFVQAKPYHWQTDTAVARNSWGYTTSLDYKSSREIICCLADVVSKNGNLLLNIGPKADGSIPEKDQQILKDIGSWLKVNGEAIYGSRCFRMAQEGPTREIEGPFSDGKETEYTSEDFRFTAGNGCIYAICMKYPKDGRVLIRTFAKCKNSDRQIFHGVIKKIEALGFSEEINFVWDEQGICFTTERVESRYPVVIKIEMA